MTFAPPHSAKLRFPRACGPSARAPDVAADGQRLAFSELLFLAAVIVGWSAMVVARGKDASWDFRNYHWYVPYAFLHGRLGFDVAVAHQATYYNPFLDLPFYLLATHLKAWITLAILGAVQGASVVPLYILSRSLLQVEWQKLSCVVLGLLSMLGGLTLYLAGATYYDNVMSLLVLSGLSLVVAQRARLAEGSIAQGALVAAAASFLLGSAVGLKLPEAPFALGLAAALSVLPGSGGRRLTRLLAAALGGLAGFAVFDGYWMAEMARLTGNPVFPYFNQFFHSPLALAAPYRDLRFIPRSLEHQLLFPLLFSLDWRVADDLPFRDIRVGVAYVLAIATIPAWFFPRRTETRIVSREVAAALMAFAAASYIAWLKVFAIYRYILVLEMLSPLLIAAAIGLWPISVRARVVAATLTLLAVEACTRMYESGRAPVTDPYVQVSIPPIPHPSSTMILMTGEAPLGYLVPSLPPQIPILRIDGWLIQPGDGSRLTAQTRRRVDAFRGDLFVIADAGEVLRSRDALASYGLAMRPAECRNIVTNLAGPYLFCPLSHTRATIP
ncbi:MAG TPA: hypothetical protein VGL35_13280 [Rhizomicrobium sp.]|jgi:hypothetical protein